MRKRDVRRIRWYVERNKFRRVWKRIAQVLACITVFCTTYALILPAITLEMEPFCGIEDHVHIPACYEPLPDLSGKEQTQLVIHSHNAFCFDRAGMVICPLEEIEAHQHSDECYEIVISQEQEKQIQEEVSATPVVSGHTHDSACYLVQRGALICSTEESQGHKHEEGCFGYKEEPVCQPEETAGHVHTEACYEKVLLCELEESEEHLHGEACLGYKEEPICQPEETTEHVHTEACYETELLCGQTESEGHLHDDACYEMEEILVCGIETTEALTGEQMETDTALTGADGQEQQSEETQITPEEQEDARTETTPQTEPGAENTESRVLVCEKQEYVAHSHSEACYETDEAGEKHLACDLPQIPEHQHSEGCLSLLEEMLSCDSVDEAHQHTYQCYTTWRFACEFCADDDGPQTDADLETAQDWEKTFADVTRTGLWPEDVLAIAKTQLDYQESGRNYEEDENGTRRGYTRYGQWWGDPYGDWNSMFVSFCLHYANVEEFPLKDSCDSWIEELKKMERYVPAVGYIPHSGDLIFLELDREERFVESGEVTASMVVDRVGIVAELVAPTEEEPAKILIIEGDKEDQVREVSYELDSPEIIGYGNLPEAAEGTYICGKVNHRHDWICYDEAGSKCCGQEAHEHTADCKTRILTYEDEFLNAELEIMDASGLPKDLTMKFQQVTRESEPAAYGAMYTAVGDAVLHSPYFVNEAVFYQLELWTEDALWQLPQEAKTTLQITLHQSVFAPEALRENAQLQSFVLTEEMPAETVPEETLSEETAAVPMLLMMTSEDGDAQEEVPVEPQIRESYQATQTSAADIGENGITFQAENSTTFGVALTAATQQGDFWKRVTSSTELTADGVYMIVSAEGNYALTRAGINGTKVYIDSVKGNTSYYEIKDANGNPVTGNALRWKFSGSGTSYTVTNVAYSDYFIDLTNDVIRQESAGSSWWNPGVSADALTLTYLPEEGSWRLRDDNRSLTNEGTTSFGRTNTTNNTSSMLIFKLVNTTLTIPDDVVSGSGGGGTTDMPQKPEYPEYIDVTDGLTGETAYGNVKGHYYSDPSTSQLEALFSGDTADNGKALSDKSVIYKDDDYGAFSDYPENTFGVTLSALGQEYLVEETTTIKTPVDVVFVLDVSGSMKYAAGNVSRAEAMVSAVNSAIDNIMAQNEHNRVGVTLFSSGAWDLLELGHYSPASNGNYLYAQGSYMSKFANDYRYQVYAYDSVRNQVQQPALESMDQANGTYTQAGIAKGAAMLERALPKTYTEVLNAGTDYEQSITVKRQPVIILLSDGEPTHCTSNYMDVLSGPHYGDGLAQSGTYQGVYGYYTILSANYYKRMVGISYDNPALFYTVGMGISENQDVDLSGVGADSDVYKRAVLNPTVSNITNLSSTINSADTVNQLKALMQNNYSGNIITVTNGNQSYMSSWMGQVHAKVPVLKNPYATNYSYAEGAYFGQIDTNELTEIFNEILLASYRVNSFGFILHNRSALMIEDPIGVGMELKAAPILRYGGVNYTHTSTSVNGNKTTYVYDYDYSATDGSRQTADLSTIVVEVIEDDTGQQTVHLHIPDMVLPAYSPYLYVDDAGNVPFYYEALPVRLIYQVGLTEESQQEIAQLEDYGGELTYYTNRYGDTFAHTDMTPTSKNPYYKPGSENDHDHGQDKTTNMTDTDPHSFECHHDKITDNGEVVPVIRQDLGNNGKLVFEADRKVIDIPVEKKWHESVPEGGTTVDIELYSVVDDTATLVDTMTLGQENQWKSVFERLPILAEGGYYALRELVPAGFAASYTGEIVEITLGGKPTRVVKIQGQNPVVEELVTVTNSHAYTLPSTGGVGTQYHTFGGALLMVAAAWMYICLSGKNQKKGGGHGR